MVLNAGGVTNVSNNRMAGCMKNYNIEKKAPIRENNVNIAVCCMLN